LACIHKTDYTNEGAQMIMQTPRRIFVTDVIILALISLLALTGCGSVEGRGGSAPADLYSIAAQGGHMDVLEIIESEMATQGIPALQLSLRRGT
jgi:uncharacterized protein YceK